MDGELVKALVVACGCGGVWILAVGVGYLAWLNEGGSFGRKEAVGFGRPASEIVTNTSEMWRVKHMSPMNKGDETK